MTENYYILVGNSYPKYQAIIDEADSQQRANAQPWTRLSIVRGATQSLVKVPGGSLEWFQNLVGSDDMEWLGMQGNPAADAARIAWYEQNFHEEDEPE